MSVTLLESSSLLSEHHMVDHAEVVCTKSVGALAGPCHSASACLICLPCFTCPSCLQAVLRLPPNRPLQAAEKMLLWRFRFSLLGDKRALTKFLKSVDWGDAQEAKQVNIVSARS